MTTDSSGASYRLDPENPWPGLAWFDETAAQFFNGRQREIAELRRLVIEAPLTVLFGRSGLGKTSLLKAGLFPALRQANVLPVYVRFDFTPPRVGPTAPLVEQLFAAFARASASAGADAPPRGDGETLWEYLHRTDFTVWSAHNEPLVPVFVTDQFEEVFTLGSLNAAAVTRLREDLADLAENRIPVATEARLNTDEYTAARFALRGNGDRRAPPGAVGPGQPVCHVDQRRRPDHRGGWCPGLCRRSRLRRVPADGRAHEARDRAVAPRAHRTGAQGHPRGRAVKSKGEGGRGQGGRAVSGVRRQESG